jgi:hypothetical protein
MVPVSGPSDLASRPPCIGGRGRGQAAGDEC